MQRSERTWIAGAVLIAAVYSFVFLVLAARGLTFFCDDWIVLERLVRLGRPWGWLAPYNQHWTPITFAIMDAQYALFGANHTLYLLVQWGFHCANVLLLALVLDARCGDARVAAIVAGLFGVTPTWREVAWALIDLQSVLCFLLTLLGFLASERARAKKSARWFAVACVSVVAAPLCWGGGLALGPALALEAWLLSPREERTRRAAPFVGAWLAFLAIYLSALGGGVHGAVARTPGQLKGAMLFFAEVVGLGFVQQVPLLDLGWGPLAGLGLFLAYAVVVAVVAYFLPPRDTTRVVLAHAYLALLLAPMALTRWYHNDREHPLAMASRYQYLPSLTWTTLVALVLARRPSRAVLGAAIVVAALLGAGHARALRHEGRMFSPYSRRDYRDGLAWVQALERSARRARGPLFDAPAPLRIALPLSPSSAILAVVAPDVAVVWTSTRTPATTAPYEEETGFAPDFTWR